MQIAFVGLGKMGGNMVRRLKRAGHDVVIFDIDQELTGKLSNETGAVAATSIAQVADLLKPPRHIWLMLPAGEITGNVMLEVSSNLDPGDTIVDGGNSRWTDDAERSTELNEKQINLVDVGTSGGVWGLENGYCMMVGGDKDAVTRLAPILDSLAPKTSSESQPTIGEFGWQHVGASGHGHFVKMVHNGIEYGMMQAYAEGYALIQKTIPEIKLDEVAHLWQQGSVVRSWLNELSARAFSQEGSELSNLEPWVEDSGEGRWTVEAAIEQSVPTPVISAALFHRFASRGEDDFESRYLSALRGQFGGHAVKHKDSK